MLDKITFIGIIAIIFIIQLSFSYYIHRQRKKFIHWLNGTMGILCTINQLDLNKYVEDDFSSEFSEMYRETLMRDWDITRRQQLLEMVDWLVHIGHRACDENNQAAAWDYSRALSLLKFGYYAGYIDDVNEALQRSLPIAKICQQEFNSWDDFMQSYFLGYRRWSEQSSEAREQIYQQLKAMPNSVYQIPWQSKLRFFKARSIS